MSTFLPLCVRIDGRPILFVGGGALAMHKLQAVLRFDADVTVLAPGVDDEVRRSGARLLLKAYEPSDLEGFFLVYACSEDGELNRRVLADAEARGVLCNIVDNREDSSFISPALFRHDAMTVAVSSDGRNARRSVEWRNAIREFLLERERSSTSNT
ncbi:bifunctional precorrin-2 dehydrogenase/sirohydrochlorin ferrochelatase [Chlorobium sp. N1]|uniref:precorrin-2 dehydrogenase/sirohydrochlorin ferrochelatase family protein n=1 Tax=Chlorobium sp. N1 TaxID=2491138 RepID=UPI00103E2E09|nr:bifunctional precorrin-2 dehydrogenase/sirohydrochlorin ferrochelatase [Chlorobium sp. N1]TCD48241.1 bifunctional precorrin-2 dehydrogenase/sirohydrochlorin ferrochelatase [Chlorobium sp. N1]